MDTFAVLLANDRSHCLQGGTIEEEEVDIDKYANGFDLLLFTKPQPSHTNKEKDP